MAEAVRPAGAQGAPWAVTGQQETTGQDAMGHFVPGVQVSFVTRGGQQGSVFVPNALYLPAKVKELVAARVAAMDAVAGLQG